MSLLLEQFRIIGLHKYRDVSIPISHNNLVLVGENGTGKTTIANLIFFCLTRQWGRMLSQVFESIEIVLNGKTLSVRQIDILVGIMIADTEISEESRHLSQSVDQNIRLIMSARNLIEFEDDTQLLERLKNHDDVSEAVIDEHLSDTLTAAEASTCIEDLQWIDVELYDLIDDHVLYLPTFRRIERDLQYLRRVYPELEYSEVRSRHALRFRHVRRRTTETYLELVEFGMEDVEANVTSALRRHSETLRRSLNDLAGTHLREVIQGTYVDVDTSPLVSLSEYAIDEVLNRIGERLFSNADSDRLRKIIDALKRDGEIQEDERVLVHFLVKLVLLHQNQVKREKPVVDFVRVCNNYLVDKKFVFDDKQFEIRIEPMSAKSDPEDIIEMSMLSSGEKQIVSLFSHIHLSGENKFFVIIDEPELSLSVDWQKKFLPDILATEKCSGLVAVTHSPYVFDNLLDEYAHDVKEFWV